MNKFHIWYSNHQKSFRNECELFFLFIHEKITQKIVFQYITHIWLNCLSYFSYHSLFRELGIVDVSVDVYWISGEYDEIISSIFEVLLMILNSISLLDYSHMFGKKSICFQLFRSKKFYFWISISSWIS